ncbi:MAG: Rieske 2Fe-2S domain-containing protein [Chloroflexi bacterium]|nr:Rieske 2Fe-2S domain-containing protein [Chloroflexota bacterium]
MALASGFVAAGSLSEIQPGQTRRVEVEGVPVLLVRVHDNIYAISDVCAHMGTSLSRGKVRGNVITCAAHGSQFDVRDGSVVKWVGKFPAPMRAAVALIKPPRPVPTYEVALEGDTIYVRKAAQRAVA